MMRMMDKDAYAEYQKIDKNEDGGLNALKYLTNWYASAVKKNPSMVDNYEKQSEEYVEKNVKDRKLDTTFAGIKTGSIRKEIKNGGVYWKITIGAFTLLIFQSVDFIVCYTKSGKKDNGIILL